MTIPEPSDPAQCPEHGFHRHSLKQPAASSAPAADPDCVRCDGTGQDPDEYTETPCTACQPSAPTTRRNL